MYGAGSIFLETCKSKKMSKKNTDEGTRKLKKRGLGKGLDALFPGIGRDAEPGRPSFFLCDIDRIRPNPYQPRREFPEDELDSLSESIKSQGLLQPLLVREAGSGFELIAGERRLRAARLAGIDQVPVVVKNVSDTELLALSIIENIQRQDLNPIEEAEAYRRLMDEFSMTQEEVADRVGKSRPAVANILRLLNLPDEIRESVRQGRLSMGHARALLGLSNPALQKKVLHVVISKHLSVRQTEKLVKRMNEEEKQPSRDLDRDAIHYSSLEDELAKHLQTKVIIRRRGKRGRLVIEFYSDDDLDRLISMLRAVK